MSHIYNDHNPPHHPHSPHSLKGAVDHLTQDASFGEEIDFVVGLTATALTADQILKLRDSKHHKAMHLAKAGLGAVAATAAFTMMAREHRAEKRHREAVRERHLEEERGRGWRRGVAVRDLEVGYAESLTDSSDESVDGSSLRRSRPMLEYRRGVSVDDRGDRDAYGRKWSRDGSERERQRDWERSRSPPRRAASRRGGEKRSQSYPRLAKFVEAGREWLEENYRK